MAKKKKKNPKLNLNAREVGLMSYNESKEECLALRLSPGVPLGSFLLNSDGK